MKLILFTFALILYSAAANACPNLAGEFVIDPPGVQTVVVAQNGCDSLVLTYTDVPVGAPHGAASYRTDGQAYEGIYNYGAQPVLASDETATFYRAFYQGDSVVFRTYSGARSTCRDTHSFTSMGPCKLYESIIRFDPSSESFTWTFTGYFRTPTYHSVDVFKLRKVN